MILKPLWLPVVSRSCVRVCSRYNFAISMSSPLASAIANLCCADPRLREAAAREIYQHGRAMADQAVENWWTDAEFASLFEAPPAVTVGLAVHRPTFVRIRQANGLPKLAQVPPDQDAEEFELHFLEGTSLDVLTTRDPQGDGVIAKFLARFGEGVQQVEFRTSNLERATQILRDEFGIQAIYPLARPGADNTRVNFFLISSPQGGKVLVELYQR
jgi:hypothetical protein